HHTFNRRVAFSPDGRHLAVGYHSGGVNEPAQEGLVWGAISGRGGHTLLHCGCACLAFSPAGRRLAAGSSLHSSSHDRGPRRVDVFDVTTGQGSLVGRYTGRGTDMGVKVAFSPDSRHLAAAAWWGRSLDGTLLDFDKGPKAWD